MSVPVVVRALLVDADPVVVAAWALTVDHDHYWWRVLDGLQRRLDGLVVQPGGLARP